MHTLAQDTEVALAPPAVSAFLGTEILRTKASVAPLAETAFLAQWGAAVPAGLDVSLDLVQVRAAGAPAAQRGREAQRPSYGGPLLWAPVTACAQHPGAFACGL
jgi:hypothetical protein